MQDSYFSESCPVVGFAISIVEPSGPVTVVLIIPFFYCER